MYIYTNIHMYMYVHTHIYRHMHVYMQRYIHTKIAYCGIGAVEGSFFACKPFLKSEKKTHNLNKTSQFKQNITT